MKLTRTVALIACVELLSALLIGSTRHACAQTAKETDQNAGAWSAEGTGSADESSSADKGVPIDIEGCWTGTINDQAEGDGTILFNFFAPNPRKLKKTSNFLFDWNAEVYAQGNLKGMVSSTGITFEGHAGDDCLVSGSGEGDSSQITGRFKFEGDCAKEFKGGTFSITPSGAVVCAYEFAEPQPGRD